jgi:CO/xanthine dehydrogenase Mo-binding subunit
VPIHATGPYRVPHVRALTRAVLTNNSVAGAFRGFGVPQAALLGELLIDELARSAAPMPLEFRHRNALRAGDRTPTGQRSKRASACANVSMRCGRRGRRRGAAEAFNAEARRRGSRCAAAPASPACGTASATP